MSILALADARFALRTEAPTDDPSRPIAKPSDVWRCWCGAARSNPYGRPDIDGRVRLEG